MVVPVAIAVETPALVVAVVTFSTDEGLVSDGTMTVVVAVSVAALMLCCVVAGGGASMKNPIGEPPAGCSQGRRPP